MINAARIKALPLAARPLRTVQRNAYRIAVIGDSTALLGHGTRWSSEQSEAGFFGRSNDPSHTGGDFGTLTIYSNGTATWEATGDSVGPVTQAGDGFVWLESGSAGNGFGFCIDANAIAESSPTGTAHSIAVADGSPSGFVGYCGGAAVPFAAFLSGSRIDITGVHGMGGTRTAKTLAIIENIFSRDSEGKPLTAPPEIVYVSVGINDVGALADEEPGLTIEDVLDNLTAIKDAIIARGCYAVFSTLSHAAPGARLPYMQDVNDHLLAMEAAHAPLVRVADYRPVIDDPESIAGVALPDYMSGPHYMPVACYAQAQVLNDLLDEIAGTRHGRSAFRGERQNLAQDGAFMGTSGVLTNATGTSAWDVSVGEGLSPFGDATAVCSKETDPNEYHPWQVIEADGNVEGGYVLASTPITTLYDRMRAEIEIYATDLTGLGGGIFDGPRLMFLFYDSGNALLSNELAGATLSDVKLAEDRLILLRTDVVMAPTAAVSARLALFWWIDVGGTVSLKMRNAGASAVPGATA